MQIRSSTFSNGGTIPKRYTCEGEGLSPPLHISDVPSAAKTLLLIMEDPDVPAWVREDQMFDHWLLFNISPDTSDILEDAPPASARHGKNTSGTSAYIGPCPPDRKHRYFFKLYALDKALPLPAGATKEELIEAMHGHVIAACELMGCYEKKGDKE